MLVWDIVFFVVFALASALSSSALELFVTRLLLGVGIGGDYPIGSTLVAEHSPPSKRGRQTAKLGFSWTLGFFTAILTGLIFLPLGPDSWRYMLAAPAIPSLVRGRQDTSLMSCVRSMTIDEIKIRKWR